MHPFVVTDLAEHICQEGVLAVVREAAHALHVLREWLGSAHVAALGLDPLDAVMLSGGGGGGGDAYAESYAWPQPWGDGGGHRQFSARAAELTDAQMRPGVRARPDRAGASRARHAPAAAATRAANPGLSRPHPRSFRLSPNTVQLVATR